jgi:hypothetical protein
MPFTGLERWDAYPEQTVVTSDPAAGVISVDLKTFTGRGRVSYLNGTCVADANVANRQLQALKVSGANAVYLWIGPAFTASATGTLAAAVGYQTAQGANYAALAEVDFAPGDILRVVVSAGQAGDDLSAITYSFKEMR